MPLANVNFILSAPNKESWPMDDKKEVCIVGKSNVGKSTFINILMGKELPEEGKIEWAKHLKVGYLDQFSSLIPGVTIRETLRTAFKDMFLFEEEINNLYMQMGDMTEDEMNAALEEIGEMQSYLENSGFYLIDSKIEEVAFGLGLKEIGLDSMVDELSGGQRAKVLLTKLLLENPQVLILDEPTNFLDEAQVNWLRNYLANYENAFILVSHDIPFLNNVINVVYHLEPMHFGYFEFIKTILEDENIKKYTDNSKLLYRFALLNNIEIIQ